MLKKNIFFAVLSTGTNYIIPLMIIPLIIASYGVVDYGKIALMLSLTGIVSLTTQLNLENTFPSLKVSCSKKNIIKIIVIKYIFFVLSSLVVCAFIFYYINIHINAFLICLFPIAFLALNLNYILIKKQDFKAIFYYNIFSKTVCAIFLFAIVIFKLDLYIIALFINAWILVSSVISFIKVYYFNFESDGHENEESYLSLLKKIVPAFSSSLASLFITILIQPMISLITNSNFTIIGLFAAAEKCIRAATGVLDAINNVMYARLTTLKEKKEKDPIIIKTLIGYLAVIAPSFFIFYSFSAEIITMIGRGKEFVGLQNTILISGGIMIVIIIGNVFSSMILFEYGIFKEVTFSILISSIFFVLLIFSPFFNKTVNFFLFCLFLSESVSMILKGWLVFTKTPFCKKNNSGEI